MSSNTEVAIAEMRCVDCGSINIEHKYCLPENEENYALSYVSALWHDAKRGDKNAMEIIKQIHNQYKNHLD